ncbi:NUDIX domain-containing protein [Candidatus Uhrbacteria bacterium]|nr:NUDIX domain-containing protein [Candidatus Uhrbacteria bacterium]
MSKERARLIEAVHLLPIKDGKILLLRRFQTGYQDGNYSVVAGHLDQGEWTASAMIREAEEEAGITITPEDLKMVHVMHRKASPDRDGIDFFFMVERWDGEIKNMEPHKCDDLSWFAFDQLPSNMVPYVRTGIERYREGKIFSEFDERAK